MIDRRRTAMMLGVLALAAPAVAAPPHYDLWQSYTTADGLPSDKTLCVLATDEEVWVGTDRGLARFRDGTWQTLTRADGLAHDAITSIAHDAETGDIWIGTLGGLSRYSAGRIDSFSQLDSGLVNDVVYGVTVVDGQMWAATAAGTSRYELGPDRWTIYDETNAPMHEIWCYSVSAGAGKVYVAVWGGGLLEYQVARDHWKHYRDPDGEMEIDLFRDDGLVHDVVSSVTVDELNRVWVATYFGLSSYDGRRWRNFLDHDSPLISNFINFVQARERVCWIATDDGLNASDRESWWTYRRDPETGGGIVLWHPADGPEERLVTETIFPHNYILGISFRGDEIWVATEQGVARGRRSRSGAVAAEGGEDPAGRASRPLPPTGRDTNEGIEEGVRLP
jgi:ligand-binding sensor domain-containing protein